MTNNLKNIFQIKQFSPEFSLLIKQLKTGVLTLLLMFSSSLPAIASGLESVQDQIKQCVTCHGENGTTSQPTFPILAGQHFYYLYVQLKDFKSGLRESPVMGPISSQLTKAQMKLLAKYFSEQKWPAIAFKPDTAAEAQGESAASAGQCVQCHLGGYEGDSRIPRLAGQYPEYLLNTMNDFKQKKRLNSAAKSSLFGTYSDDDIKAMSEYLAGK